MESPFSAENTTIVLYLEPFLDSYNKTYINILTLSGMPKGPLENMVTRIHPRALSEYQSSSLSLSRDCMHALLRYPKSGGGSMKNPYMYAEDIPSVLSYLISNGYTIDTQMTNMLLKNSGVIQNRKMICMFSYSL